MGLQDSFVEGCSKVMTKDGIPKWKKMLQLVKNPQYRGRTGKNASAIEYVPRCFLTLGGDLTAEKIDLANQMIRDWQLGLKKKVKKKTNKKKINIDEKDEKEEECPYYQPLTQSAELRMFFGHMKHFYYWQFTMKTFKGFEGSVSATAKQIFNQRYEEWVSRLFKF